jgi:ABC-type nitrate/sulfonate/bicarbonate transport system substrate-binding protein
MKTIRVALEGMPSVLHAGMYLALARGWYREAGLEIQVIEPESFASPMKLLVSGQVHLAIAPAEAIVSYRTLRQEMDVVAIGTIQQEHHTALATLHKSGIVKPAQLDGKRYGAHQARFEAGILRKIVRNNGGCGMFRILTPPRETLWSHLLNGDIDATWVSIPKRIPLAEKAGISLNLFKPEDYGVMAGYMHLFVAHRCLLDEYEADFKLFMEITSRAYEDLGTHPETAASLLHHSFSHEAFNNLNLLLRSVELLCPTLLDAKGHWGTMSEETWLQFGNWLDRESVVLCLETDTPIPVAHRIREWFSNEYLPSFRSAFVLKPGETA